MKHNVAFLAAWLLVTSGLFVTAGFVFERLVVVAHAQQPNGSNPMVTFFVTWHGKIQYSWEHIGVTSTGTLVHSSELTGTGVMHYTVVGGGAIPLLFHDGRILMANSSYRHESWDDPPSLPPQCSFRKVETLSDPKAGFMGVEPALDFVGSPLVLTFRGDGVAKIHHDFRKTCPQPETGQTISEDVDNPFIQTFFFDAENLPPEKLELKADGDDQSSFSVHFKQQITTEKGEQGEKQGSVEWIAHAYVSKCAESGAGPIVDGDPPNPIIKHEDVEVDVDKPEIDATPFDDTQDGSGRAVVTITATCDQVPIQNADVKVSAKAEDQSGGHKHPDDDRPLGMLNKTELTKQHPSITVKTGADGKADVIFEAPAKGVYDATYSSVKRTYKRGIAGVYNVTAESVRFPESTKTVAIKASVKDLQEMPLPSANYELCCATASHPAGFYGTAGTLRAFGNLANDFTHYQTVHNAALQSCGQHAWLNGRVQLLSINDIALPTGGLFDYAANWEPTPGHYSHNKGEGGDFNRFGAGTDQGINYLGNGTECDGSTVPITAWLIHVLLDFGQPAYGKWDCFDLGNPPGCDQGKYPESFTSTSDLPNRLHLHVEDK